MKIWHKIFLISLGLSPSFAFAQKLASDQKTIGGILNFLTGILSSAVVPLLFGIALVVFIWGVIQYITAAGDQEKRTAGLQYIIWGIVGLFVMTAVWSLVGVLGETFGIKFGIPQLKTGD